VDEIHRYILRNTNGLLYWFTPDLDGLPYIDYLERIATEMASEMCHECGHSVDLSLVRARQEPLRGWTPLPESELFRMTTYEQGSVRMTIYAKRERAQDIIDWSKEREEP